MVSKVTDTLKISKQLEAANLTKVQADAIAEALAEVTTAELATKNDLSQLELRVTKELSGLSKEIGSVRDSLTGRINVILWAIGGVGIIAWVLQVFGTAIRHVFSL
jgi:hypothetical protein